MTDTDQTLTFDESLELSVSYLTRIESNFEREQQNVEKLMLFIKTSGGVSKDVVSQVVDDVKDSLTGDRRFSGSGKRQIEKL